MNLFANLRPAPAVAEQAAVSPEVWRLLSWAADKEGGRDEKRLVCLVPNTHTARLTSAIVAMSPTTEGAVFVTESGRSYEVHTGPTQDQEMCEMLHARAALTNPFCTDVSDEMWASLTQPGPRIRPA